MTRPARCAGRSWPREPWLASSGHSPCRSSVCAIAPGGFLTPRVSSPQVQELLVEDVLFPKRLGRPHEYALLVETIVRNPYLNGEVIRLDAAARLGPEMGWRRRS